MALAVEADEVDFLADVVLVLAIDVLDDVAWYFFLHFHKDL